MIILKVTKNKTPSSLSGRYIFGKTSGGFKLTPLPFLLQSRLLGLTRYFFSDFGFRSIINIIITIVTAMNKIAYRLRSLLTVKDS